MQGRLKELRRAIALGLAAAMLFGAVGIMAPKEVAAAAKPGVYVEKNSAVDDDFITGVDISSYIAEKKSGVTYYDFEGNALDDAGFFAFLKKCGVNYIRVRVWNDPYENGKGYGGGNCDLASAIAIGKYATGAGMKLMVDFHLSDFWADPSKQHAPKAWRGMSVEQKAAAAKAYITDSLNEMKRAGVNIGMVQVGNETDHGVAEETEPANFCAILKAGAEGVRAVDKNILVAIHYANSAEEPLQYAGLLKKYGVDYDVFALSYYTFWHGTLTKLEDVMKAIAGRFGKQVLVTENYWPYTLEDSDGWGNMIAEGTYGLTDKNWSYSPQGQITEIASVIRAVTNVGDAGIGFMYWEPAWIAPQYAYDENGNLIDSIDAANQEKYEAYGSGGGTPAAREYGPEDTVDGRTQGNGLENLAWFDFYGHPLESANVYNYIRKGASVTATVGKIQYRLTQNMDGDGNYSLSAVVAGADKSLKKVEIPQSVKIGGISYKVTAVADGAFSGNKKITSVRLPKSIKRIGKNAFKNASNLKTLTVQTSALTSGSVGANAFSGTPKNIRVSVPGAKMSAYRKLFTGKGMNKKATFKKL